jgi:hypothetical protein
MQTRLRTGSLSRNRQQSIDTDDGRQSLGSLDFGISDDAGAQLVAGLKDGNMTTTEETTTTRRSAPRAIPQAAGTASLSGSQESSASGFLSGIMNPNTLSHTPPTQSSYEQQHFGKRPRSGVSDYFFF